MGNKMSLVYEGRCWKLGDDVSSDELISAQHVFEYDPQKLRQHFLQERLPELAKQARKGDILLAGKRFAHGSQHTHPFLAMRAIGLGLLAQNPSRPAFRLAIYSGTPLLDLDKDSADSIIDGDILRVDFTTGEITNLTSENIIKVAPLPEFLMEIVESGGGMGFLQRSKNATTHLGTQ